MSLSIDQGAQTGAIEIGGTRTIPQGKQVVEIASLLKRSPLRLGLMEQPP
jgi:hypothetical protein